MTVLIDAYDLVILDLDGVVILADRPVPGAVEALERVRAMGVAVRFATNNASRRADEVASLLTSMGIAAVPAEVLTSAGAAASVLAQRFPADSPILVVGAPALYAEIAAVGLRPVSKADDAPVAVVQGYGPLVGWADLAEACIAIRAGALWVATNTDRTLPTPRGPLPGNGSLVAALATALEKSPDLVVGKPQPSLFTAAAQSAGSLHNPLVVGDRLDTDIAGARLAGMDSLLVLSGVASRQDADEAAADQKPTFVAADLTGLFAPISPTER